MPLAPGRRFGSFEVTSLLGAGGKWKKFVEIYEDLAEEQTLTRKLFGTAFWRAYTAVVQESE